jgi:hypothetical protein
MPLPLSRESFDACLGHRFVLKEGGGATRVTHLRQVTPLGRHPAATRESFSLIFECEDAVVWPQGSYEVIHESLGTAVIFVVPIGPDPDSKRLRYQAVFN